MSLLKKSMLGAVCASAMMAAVPAQAANWLMLQGTEPAASAPRAKVWGFIQPTYQSTDGTTLAAGPFAGQDAAFNVIAPNNQSTASFNIFRARIGVRGTSMPLDSNVNYFILAELGNNGITTPGGGKGSTKLTDASVTFNNIDGARVRVGLFKTPGSEEGLQAIHVFDYVNFTNVTNQLTLERHVAEDGTGTSVNGVTGPVGAFRDTGVQVFDTFNVGGMEHSYAVMIGNGNTSSTTDNNEDMDTYLYYSAEKVFGGKGPWRQGWKTFVWSQTGKRDLINGASGTSGSYDRTRQGFGTVYRKGKLRTAFEYIMADGMIFNGTDGGAVAGATNNAATGVASVNMEPNEKADGYYLHLGYLVTPKWEVDFRHDTLNRATETAAKERTFTTNTIGAQYFFNKKNRLTINYEMRSLEAPNLPAASPVHNILGSMDDRLALQVTSIF